MFEAILWILFVLTCVVVSAVILLQEGKGGGLSEAFGGVGQQAFGVKAEGINKFTGWATAVLVVLAILITKVRTTDTVVQFDTPPDQASPAAPLDAGAAPPAEAPAPAAPAGDAPAEGPQ